MTGAKVNNRAVGWAKVVCLVWAIVILFPVSWIVLGVFKSNQELFATSVLWPKEFNTRYLQGLFSGEYFPYYRAVGNSLLNAFAVSLLSCVAAFTAAFQARNLPSSIRAVLLILAVLLVALPVQTLAVSYLKWLSEIGLVDTRLGIWGPYLASGVGYLYFSFCLMKLPRSLLEAAKLDGAGPVRLCLLAAALMRPNLITFFCIQFLISWNEHFLSVLVVYDQDLRTIPLEIASLFLNDLRIPQAVLLGCVVMASLPPLLLIVFSRRVLRNPLNTHSEG